MKCPNCQTTNPDEAKFCMNCGTSLATAVQAPSIEGNKPQASIQSLNRFIPQELMTKFEAARTRDAMTGERRIITMLFCDVKGSTAAAEKVDPEVWTDIMNGIFEIMIRPIYKYEGLVPRLMGDAILAFFGAPIAHEDDPQRAVLAGLEIQQGIKLYADEIRIKHGLEFGLRVGINTGLVIVGEIGSDLRMEYTAIGDAINLAARMEQTAQAGTVQISEETYKLVAPFFEFEPLGEVEVKGKSAPIKTYRPLAVKSKPGQSRGLEGLSSPLVGRDSQIALLNEQMENLLKGTGSFVAVVGEAGLGKSSLIAELKKSHPDSNYRWLRGDALSYTRSISYFPWRQMIRQAIEASDDDSPAEVRHKLGYVCDCCTLPGGDIPFLEAMLAVESDESSKVVMGYQGEALVQRMVEATRGYLCGLATDNPIAIVFDDLHWADEASLNLLLNIADLNTTQPILFLCMLRPDKTALSWDTIHKIEQKLGQDYHSILLEALPVEQTETLLSNLLGMKDFPKSIRDLIVEKAEGNPFFVEELIRSLIETKQIIRENNHWKAVGESAKISLPNTLRGVLSARIDRLPEVSRHVLQNAAVVGRSFDLRVLKQLTHLNGGFDPQIQYLKEASLIEPLRDEYAFRHVLIQEAAYESILIKIRTQIHKQIGETLEDLHADRIEEFAPLLAYHFYSAQDARSLKYDLLAGEKAARLYANAEAATHFRRALEIAKRNTKDIEQISKLYSQLGNVLELAGRHEQALENYNEMQAFGREHGAPSIEITALMAKATMYSIYTRLHDSTLSEQMLIQALDISREIGDRAAQAKLNWNLMLVYLFSKRLDQSLTHGEIALSLARESNDREQLAFVLNDLCRLYACLGEFEKAYSVISEARALWRELDNQAMFADSLGSEAEARFNAGDFDKTLELTSAALQLSEKIENLWGQAYDRMILSFVYFDQGKIGKAIQLASESIQLGDKAGLLAGSIGERSDLGLMYGRYGDIPKGLELVTQAIEIADTKQPLWRNLPVAAEVRLQLLQGNVQAAEQIAGSEPLGLISIPYPRYTVLVEMANIELALAKQDFSRALIFADNLLATIMPVTRVDIPEVMSGKAGALIGLGRLNEAHQTLVQACSLAEGLGSKHSLWLILVTRAEVALTLNQPEEADKCIKQARGIVEEIAESLGEVRLRELFLQQPNVQRLITSA